MKRHFILPLILVLLLLAFSSAFASENATVTEDNMPLMKAPSFISEETGSVMKNERIEALSRTSFTDRLAAIPDDYWYFVRASRGGAILTGYLHGSVLVLDPGATIPIFDPPGFAPKAPAPKAKRYTVRSSVDDACRKTYGALTVPEGMTATHFTITRFDSSFTPCPGQEYGSIIGFSIVSAENPGNELFSYEEHIADDPAELQYVKDGFYYFDLESGNYTVTIRGGRDTTLELTYGLVNAN